MSIRILYFAGLRETLAEREESIDPTSDIHTVSDLRAALAARGGKWSVLATMKNLKAAVNQSMAGPDQALEDGDEVAFFPPVTGG